MIHELTVIDRRLERSGGDSSLADVRGTSWFEWSTCIRQVRIGLKDGARPPADETAGVFVGPQAYRHLLEVICGLHSPLVGETEVLGQFREWALSLDRDTRLAKLFDGLIADAKVVRQNHLVNLGANSYGSLTRKHTRDFDPVAIVGAGKLALEILTWLKGKKLVEVFARDPEKSACALKAFPNVVAKDLGGETSARALVLAAPVTSDWFRGWHRDGAPELSLLIDLRDSSSSDLIRSDSFRTVALEDFFSELHANRDRIGERIDAAREEIAKLSERRLNTQELRPFGWDDLCA